MRAASLILVFVLSQVFTLYPTSETGGHTIIDDTAGSSSRFTGCTIEACSRSQGDSLSDGGQNYCNLKMLCACLPRPPPPPNTLALIYSRSCFTRSGAPVHVADCGKADGCKPVLHDFKVGKEVTEPFEDAVADMNACLVV